jgi:protein TonB
MHIGMLSADNLSMKSGILITPNAASFDSMGGHDPLAGRALKFLAVLCMHVALIVWILHVRKDAPEEIDPIRVSVRLVEAAAAPAPPSVAPEPVRESPQPLPQEVRSAVPVKPPVRDVVRKIAPQPQMTAPPQLPVVESSIRTPIAPPSVIAVRYDADYLNNPAPVYPILSRRRGEQGKVLLLVQVTAQGLAEKVEIQTSSGYLRLDSAALEAVKRWRFVPARRGDEAIAASVVVPIVFRLGD